MLANYLTKPLIVLYDTMGDKHFKQATQEQYREAKKRASSDPLAEVSTEDGNFFKFSQIRRVRDAYAVEYFEFFVFPIMLKNGEKYKVDRFRQAVANKTEKEKENISALGIENFLKNI